jgi:hypothetical protein
MKQQPPRPIDEPILPKNLAAERAVIGGVMIPPNSDRLSGLRDIVRPEHFFLAAHGTIYKRELQMFAEHEAIDVMTVQDALDRAGELQNVGGPAYLSSLIDGIPVISNLEHYAHIVADDHARRVAIAQAQAIIRAGCDREDVAEIKQRFAATASLIKAPDERAIAIPASVLSVMNLKPREWLLDNLLTAKSMNEIFAWRGIGKTWFALGLAHAIASAAKFGKWQASRPRQVLYVDGELDAASLQQRIKLLGAADDRDLKLLCCDMQDDPFPNLATARAQRMIENALGDDGELLILDNLSALAPSSNETEAEDWILIQSWLLNLRRQGVASVFLHHAGHSGWSRGTTRREDLLDLVIELRRPKDYVASEGLRFELHFAKTRGMLGSGAEPVEARLGTDFDGNLTWTWRDLEDIRIAKIVELKNSGSTWREIESLTGIPRSTAERLYRRVPSPGA